MSIQSHDDVYTWWAAIGGTSSRFNQVDALPQGATRQYVRAPDALSGEEIVTEIDVRGGICATLALKFVESRLTGCADIEALRQNLLGNLDIAMFQQAMYQSSRAGPDGVRRRLKSGDQAGGVDGLRTGGYGCRRAVKSRAELCDKVVASRQLSIYSFGNQRCGHAVAFDSTDDFFFFDPNFGIFKMENLNRPSFIAWFKALWDFRFIAGNESYKSLFPKGRREILEFGKASVRFQLSDMFVSAPRFAGVTGF